MQIVVRKEQTDDIQSIYEVTKAAFLAAPHSSHTEHFIVNALREAGALSVSLVAEYQSNIIGHVAISPVSISDGANDWYGLGPISVHPEHQQQGIGSKLMKAAIQELKAINAGGCVLLGDPNYYQRFGFAPKAELVLKDVPAEYFQTLLLQRELPQGFVTYHEAFFAES
ncbi:MAG: N-acetyltransferase [Gammaproteobacteria bacterium]|nr:N-acetyltransferase [Gammaproteobacteria bacterium]